VGQGHHRADRTEQPRALLRRSTMWYFTWILGVLLACSFGIINALWLETTQDLDAEPAGDE